jgi:glycerol uptake facilitator-like aquaporin
MYATKRWSGGHLNPAITTALLLIGEAGMEVNRWSTYCAAQMLGAIAGAGFLRIFCPETAISRNPFVTQASDTYTGVAVLCSPGMHPHERYTARAVELFVWREELDGLITLDEA